MGHNVRNVKRIKNLFVHGLKGMSKRLILTFYRLLLLTVNLLENIGIAKY